LNKSSRVAQAAKFVASVHEENRSMSQREACELAADKYSVSVDSIRSRLQRSARQKREGPKRHAAIALSEAEEKTVVGFILCYDMYSSPLQPIQILSAVNDVFKKNLTFSWVRSFLKRNKSQLKKAKTRALSSQRITGWTPADIRNWLAGYQNFLLHHHFPAHARFNIDETRLTPPTTKSRIVAADELKPSNRESKVQCLGSLVPIICANGSVFMSFYILKHTDEFKFKTVRLTQDEKRRGSWPRRYAFTATGFTNAILWKKMLLEFATRWNTLNPGLNALLFMDNCSVHRSGCGSGITPNLMLTLARLGVFIYFLPNNTTSWLQPLDQFAFGQLKICMGRTHADVCFSAAINRDTSGKFDLSDVRKCENEAFIPSTIRKSWNVVGLYKQNEPTIADEQLIMERARRNFGSQKPEEDPVVHTAIALSRHVIDGIPDHPPRGESEITVEPDFPYNADQVNALIEKQMAAKKTQQQQKADLRAAKEKEILDRRNSRLNEKTRKEAEKALKRQARTEKQQKVADERALQVQRSRCGACSKIFRQGPSWSECETCSLFIVCNRCEHSKSIMETHEAECEPTQIEKKQRN
jgi:DNA-directed RNA polymerase subunit M/transcription elongation factor TFIIS